MPTTVGAGVARQEAPPRGCTPGGTGQGGLRLFRQFGAGRGRNAGRGRGGYTVTLNMISFKQDNGDRQLTERV